MASDRAYELVRKYYSLLGHDVELPTFFALNLGQSVKKQILLKGCPFNETGSADSKLFTLRVCLYIIIVNQMLPLTFHGGRTQKMRL